MFSFLFDCSMYGEKRAPLESRRQQLVDALAQEKSLFESLSALDLELRGMPYSHTCTTKNERTHEPSMTGTGQEALVRLEKSRVRLAKHFAIRRKLETAHASGYPLDRFVYCLLMA